MDVVVRLEQKERLVLEMVQWDWRTPVLQLVPSEQPLKGVSVGLQPLVDLIVGRNRQDNLL